MDSLEEKLEVQRRLSHNLVGHAGKWVGVKGDQVIVSKSSAKEAIAACEGIEVDRFFKVLSGKCFRSMSILRSLSRT
jgi:hypothetical protein